MNSKTHPSNAHIKRIVDAEGDFVHDTAGEWVIIAGSFADLLVKCQEIVKNSKEYLKDINVSDCYSASTNTPINEEPEEKNLDS